jgi:hypothetical protein
MEQLEDRTSDAAFAVRRKSILDLYIAVRPLVAALGLADGAPMPPNQVSEVIKALHYGWKFADVEYGYEHKMPAPEVDRQEVLSMVAAMRRFSKARELYDAKRDKKAVPAKANRAAQAYLRTQPEHLTKEELTANVRITARTWDDCVADALINRLEDELGRPIVFRRNGNGFGRNNDLLVLEAFFRVAAERARERPDRIRYKQVRDIGAATWFASRLRTRSGKQRVIQRTVTLEVGRDPDSPG